MPNDTDPLALAEEVLKSHAASLDDLLCLARAVKDAAAQMEYELDVKESLIAKLAAAEADTERKVAMAIGYVWAAACAGVDEMEEHGWQGPDIREKEIPELTSEVDAMLALDAALAHEEESDG